MVIVIAAMIAARSSQQKKRRQQEEQHLQVPAVGMNDNSQPAVGQKQAAKMVQYLDYFCFDESVRQL